MIDWLFRIFDRIYRFCLRHIGWFLIAIISMIGIGLFIWGKYELSFLQTGETDKWADIAAGLGTLLCASGVSGAVLKLIATQGFFKEAVAEVMYGEHAMGKLSEAAIVEIWAQATKLLYLRNMRVDDAPDANRLIIENLRNDVSSAMKERERDERPTFPFVNEVAR